VPPSFCPFSLYYFHFRCFNLVPAQNPMFVLWVPIRQKTEVSQQKFVQKHSHQHTFSWFQSLPSKSGHAELVCTDTDFSLDSAGQMGINKIACCKLSNVNSQHQQHFRLLKLNLHFTVNNLTQRHWQVINSAAALTAAAEGCLHCFLPYVGVVAWRQPAVWQWQPMLLREYSLGQRNCNVKTLWGRGPSYTWLPNGGCRPNCCLYGIHLVWRTVQDG